MLSKQTAYEKWLSIKLHDQPPTLYRLLGVEAFETDPDTISYAADSRMTFLKQFQVGDNAPLAEGILNEVSQARVTLLNADKKARYDAKLRQRPAVQNPPTGLPGASATPLAVAQPLAQPVRPSRVAPASPGLDLESLTSNFRTSTSTSLGKNRKKINPLVWVAASAGVVLVVVAIAVVSPSGGEDSSAKTPTVALAKHSETPKPSVHAIAAEPSIARPADKPTANPLSVEPASASPEPAVVKPSAPIVVARQESPPLEPEKPTPSPPVETPAAPVVGVATTSATPPPTPEVSAQEKPTKPAPPTPDQIKQAEATIADVYKKQLAHPDKEFGRQLLKLAQDTKDDFPSQYVLLRKAVDVGAVTGDSQTVYSAIDELAATFDVNAFPIWIAAFEPLSKRADISDRLATVFDEAYQADDYDSASALANLWLASARNAKDSAAVKIATSKVKEVAAARAEFTKSTAARQKLHENPADPEANRIVGSFLCFVKKDLEKGIPMLALADDPALKKVASADMGGDKPVEIGDAWNKFKGGQDRALYWYKKALPDLSGLQKARVEKLVKELEPEPAWVNLLEKVDVTRDAVLGTWRRNGNTLAGAGANQCSRIMFPTPIDGNYELAVEFSRDSGGDDCVFDFPVGERSAMLGLSASHGGVGGLQRIDGMDMFDTRNPAVFRPSQLRNGQRYQVTIRVRLAADNAIVDAFLDNRQIVHWRGKAASLSPEAPWSMPQPKRAGFGHTVDPVTLYGARVEKLN